MGDPVYGIDASDPGLKHVAVVGTRALFGVVTAVTNEAEILARRGVEAVVIVQEGVAVVDTYKQKEVDPQNKNCFVMKK